MSLEKTVDVKFPSEKDKVAYSDVIKGFDYKTYKFRAKKGQHLQILLSNEWSEHIHIGFAPIFPDICYHLTHYKPAAADIPVASDNPAHYADAIRYNAR
ncbi:hypothetical protein KZA98_26575, partial [Escherichia coli]|nr:hypothetical protein [Escherichia coli]